MYSPKIKEDYIPHLYRHSKICKMPMTKLVNRIIGDYLKRLKQADRENMARAITQDILSKKR